MIVKHFILSMNFFVENNKKRKSELETLRYFIKFKVCSFLS